ncbi:MAG: carotenoid 1,2-hydratase [Betaproteobacteria bacterium]|nr:carotenoid 1,2-hydratase [Betaproteobacteria bacterium]
MFASQRPSRRQCLQWLPAALACTWAIPSQGVALASTRPANAQPLRFPRDLGAHLDADIEWWYLTGYLHEAGATIEDTPHGFQITFFRKRIPSTQALSQQLTAKHLLFAHAALTWSPNGQTSPALRHDQRMARWNGQPQTANDSVQGANAQRDHMDVFIGHGQRAWRIDDQGAPAGPLPTFRTRVAANNFTLDLNAASTQAVVLQGDQGWSQKGPDPTHASWYTTHPQLTVSGRISVDQQPPFAVSGRAWLDHEWSAGFMPADAVGWDWIGMNFDDGSALTLFQMRRADGQAVWAGGSWRDGEKRQTRAFQPNEITWQAINKWVSPKTGINYPAQWRILTPVGMYTVEPVSFEQELDSRESTGTIYWEGLSALRDARGRRVAWGYLEMTGYGNPIEI